MDTNKCNLHDDCAAADEAVREVTGRSEAFHCRDEGCQCNRRNQSAQPRGGNEGGRKP